MDIDVFYVCSVCRSRLRKIEMNDQMATLPYVSKCCNLRHKKSCACIRLINLITTRIQEMFCNFSDSLLLMPLLNLPRLSLNHAD